MALPTPQGKQREVLALPPVRHLIVLGTAGSGKTTLAILRASLLSRAFCEEGERVLLITFNKALVTFLEAYSEGQLERVDVVNYHKFARGYLNYRKLIGPWGCLVKHKNKKLSLIEEAIKTIIETEGENAILNKRPEVFCEEIGWLQKMGIRDLEEYKNAVRTGRSGTRIRRSDRIYFFNVYQRYLEIRRYYGYWYDWDDMAYHVKTELENDADKRLYKHIVIDEGQDFSPMMIQSLSKAIPDNGSLTFFGDVAQQIYGSRISWRSAGLYNPEIWYFEENYRNTKEIASLALAISHLPFFVGIADLVEPRSPKASGPLPMLASFRNEIDEINIAINTAINESKVQTVAILVRDRETVNRIIGLLRTKRIAVQELHGEMGYWNSSPGVSVGTYHSAKGLEFDVVILPYCNNIRLPDPSRIIELESEDEAMAEEVKLIYVGVTRAKQRLLITYTGELTLLLPRNDELYQRFSR